MSQQGTTLHPTGMARIQAHPGGGNGWSRRGPPNADPCTVSPTPAPENLGGPSVFIFPPKPKDTLSISRTPEVTCLVVDVSQDDPDVQITWFVDNTQVHTAKTKPREEQFNSTYRVVSVLPILHKDWLEGKEFKCKVNSKALPSPIEKTISKAKGGQQDRWGTGRATWGLWDRGQPSPMRVTLCVDL